MDHQIVDRAQAEILVRDYACAGCWGHLTTFTIKDSQDVKVTCLNCGDERGLVSKYWVARRRSQDIGDGVDVREMLEGIKILPPRQRKSPEQISKELGF